MDQRFDKQITVLSKEEKVFDNPVPIQPVLIDVDYDLSKMKKILTLKNVKHVYKDKSEGKMTIKEYSHSYVFIHKYTDPMTQAEVNIIKKENKIKEINEEISELNLDDYKTKESILKFGCDNGKSNGEKRLRCTLLQQKQREECKRLSLERNQKEKEKTKEQLMAENNQNERMEKLGSKKKSRYEYYKEREFYPRHRITTEEISVY